MLKARTRNRDGEHVVLLGLSAENIDRLKAGKPIHVKLSELGLKGDILLVYGESEESLMAELKQAGLSRERQDESAEDRHERANMANVVRKDR